MSYKITDEEMEKVHDLLSKAEDILRNESLLWAKIINDAHYTVHGLRIEKRVKQ